MPHGLVARAWRFGIRGFRRLLGVVCNTWRTADRTHAAARRWGFHMMRKMLAVAATATLSLVAFTTTAPTSALARGGALEGGNRPGGPAAGGGGGAARPRAPTIPGRSGASGGRLLEERRKRTKRLRDVSAPQPTAVRSGVTPSGPTRPPGRNRGGSLPMPGPTADTSLVHVHHGKVRMFAGLARVDLTLEVQNVGTQIMEWRRGYVIDPACEIIGAVLMRENRRPITARTLTTWDAFQCYARIRTPPQTRRPPTRPRDPLLVSRPQRDRLEIQIWPIIVQETIRVRITFVTPLRGEGARRTYRDVMGGAVKLDRPTPRLSRPDSLRERPRRPASAVNHNADWLMHPGELVLSSAPATGMTYGGAAGGQLHFTGFAATERGQPAPTVPFLSPKRSTTATMVGSGRLSGRIAAFRFDPNDYLKRKGFVLTTGMKIHLKAHAGASRRIVPNIFTPNGEPRPVTAQVLQPNADTFKYRVQVLNRHGVEVVEFEESLPLEKPDVDDDLAAAVSGWHRAHLAHRVFRWAGSISKKRQEAVRYAVDLGVLMPGIAAIAIPANERQRLTPQLRRLYSGDGVNLGAAKHEADAKQPPRGSLDD